LMGLVQKRQESCRCQVFEVAGAWVSDSSPLGRFFRPDF
jgi:hypothetical protein